MPKKTPRQIAEEQWLRLEGLLRKVYVDAFKVYVDAFIDGYKHGKKGNKEG